MLETLKHKLQMKKLNLDNKAQGSVPGGIVTGIIGLFVTIAIGAIIFWEILGSLDTENATANETLSEVSSMGSTVFGLMVLIGLVIVASVIIAAVRGFGGK